ncbi:hypothetical protein [Nocardioides phosphati]|uniref:hypothetical protein n=1 Tax=Nocardioides phosphati TaxID=1867775 RepID=UPI00166C7097|nr:hypothetical protein [Nocardioides phosphati]
MCRFGPQDPWERHDAVFVSGLACVLGLVAAVLGRRWWRASGGVADADARRTP